METLFFDVTDKNQIFPFDAKTKQKSGFVVISPNQLFNSWKSRYKKRQKKMWKMTKKWIFFSKNKKNIFPSGWRPPLGPIRSQKIEKKIFVPFFGTKL